MTLKFGTDGLRGVANAELTPELVLALGRAAARVVPAPEFIVGRDTRLSGPLLQAALAAGLASEGVRVADVGVIPTPGLAWLSATRQVPAAMISASHNPFPDNGVKLFGSGGTKLSDPVERALETELGRLVAEPTAPVTRAVVGGSVGRIDADPAAVDQYSDHLVASLDGRRLDGLRCVLDCASGAASRVAPSVLARLGADVSVIADAPDGTNINDGCGSTHPEGLQRAVVAAGADVGLAFDGDADRVLAVDHAGTLVDGDHLMALFAVDLLERGLLASDTVVVTVMTNLGMLLALEARGIRVCQTQVGDRHVLVAIEEGGYTLGGEQSGHIIFRQLATTGDGILTGLQLLDLLRRRGRPLAELAGEAMTRLPQELVSVAVPRPDQLASAGAVWEEVAAVEAELGRAGRVLLRASGTEPVVRVMVEAQSAEQARAAVDRLCRIVRRQLGDA
ncbi:MAG TPA: phosphoglucosamine mutase [Acidimicrobiales bacterium]